MRRLTALLAGLLATLPAGCTGASSPQPTPVTPVSWRQVRLPLPLPAPRTPAAAGTVAIRALADCPGHWYAVGGRSAPDGSTSPLAWSSPDGARWAAMATRPASAYGPAHVLSAVACHGDQVVALGSAPGGAHGNLRTGTWYGDDRALTETPAAFELFGGPQAIGVGQLAAGSDGWLIEGGRQDADGRAGAAVWFGIDGRSFRLVDSDPQLESGTGGQTTAEGAAALPEGGFLVLGNVLPPGSKDLSRRPLAWRSPDGLHWTRESVPAEGTQDADLQRAIPYRAGMLVLGLRGNGFGAWSRDRTGWHVRGSFGTFAGTDLPEVSGLADSPDGTCYALVSTGARHQLWVSRDLGGWRQLPLPAAIGPGRDRTMALTGLAGRLLLAVTDGGTARLWTAPAG